VGLLPRHPQLDHHPLFPFVIDHEMAMEEQAPVVLKVCARYGLATSVLGIKGRGPQDDVLAVERAVALANRHRRLPRVIPHRSEAIRFGIEAGDSGARALRSVRIEEREIRLQKLAVLDHVLLTRAFRHARVPAQWEERLDDIPVARKIARAASDRRPVRSVVRIDCGFVARSLQWQ
jgi:hypothetical protein